MSQREEGGGEKKEGAKKNCCHMKSSASAPVDGAVVWIKERRGGVCVSGGVGGVATLKEGRGTRAYCRRSFIN